MIETNLILVDGLSGSGKSTTGQRLYMHLLRQGVSAQWSYEHDTTHPIYPIQDVEQALESGESGIRQLQETALTRWQRLAETLAGSQQVVLLDGALLQINVGLLCMGAGWERSAIHDYMQRIDRALAPIRPLLIYLYQADIPSLLLRTLERRGESYGEYLLYRLNRTPQGRAQPYVELAQVVDLFRRFQSVVESLLPALTMRQLSVDVGERTWADYERRITDALQLPPIQDPPTPFANLDRFAGRYKDENSDDIFTIVADGGHLYLDQTTSKARLYHKEDAVFFVEGMSIEVSFARDGDGAWDRLECRSNLPGLSPIWRKL